MRLLQSVEDDSNVGRRHPVLKYRTVVEVLRRRATFEGDEGDARPGGRVQSTATAVGVRADRLLLVGLADDAPRRPTVHLSTLRRVELKGNPRFAVVDALVHRHRVGSGGAELQAYVGHFELLAERQRQGDVIAKRRRRRGRFSVDVVVVWFRYPTGDVVRIVEVRQKGWRVTSLRTRCVAYIAGCPTAADRRPCGGRFRRRRRRSAAVRGPAATAAGSGETVARRRVAAGARRLDRSAEGGVDEVGDAATSGAVVVVTRIGCVLLLKLQRETVDKRGGGGRRCAGHHLITRGAEYDVDGEPRDRGATR